MQCVLSPENKPRTCLVTLLIDFSFYMLTDPPTVYNMSSVKFPKNFSQKTCTTNLWMHVLIRGPILLLVDWFHIIIRKTIGYSCDKSIISAPRQY